MDKISLNGLIFHVISLNFLLRTKTLGQIVVDLGTQACWSITSKTSLSDNLDDAVHYRWFLETYFYNEVER